MVEAIKYELKKYIKRERNKKLPKEVDFWDFDCRYGTDEASCGVIHISEINKVISKANAEGLDSFFLEILSKPGVRTKKPEKEKRGRKFSRLSSEFVRHEIK